MVLADQGSFFIIGFVFVAIGLALFAGAIRRHRRSREIEDLPRSKVSSAPQGLCELQGYAWDMSGWIGNSLDQEAVLYEFELQRLETRGTGKSRRKEWVTVFRKHHYEPFYLVDPTGIAIVKPARADLEISSSRKTLWTRLKREVRHRLATEVIGGGISSFPPSDSWFGLFNKKYRIIEREILNGSPLYACGEFCSKALESSGRSTATSLGLSSFANRVFDNKNRSHKLSMHHIDKNGDKQISQFEARNGYPLLAKICRTHASTNKAIEEQEFQIHGELKSSQNRKLFLADLHEEHLVANLKRALWLRLGGGSTIMAMGVIAILMNFYSLDEIDDFTAKNALLSKRSALMTSPLRSISSVTQTEMPAPDPDRVNQWHQECLGLSIYACNQLIDNAAKLQLSAEHIKQYRDKIRQSALQEESHRTQ